MAETTDTHGRLYTQKFWPRMFYFSIELLFFYFTIFKWLVADASPLVSAY